MGEKWCETKRINRSRLALKMREVEDIWKLSFLSCPWQFCRVRTELKETLFIPLSQWVSFSHGMEKCLLSTQHFAVMFGLNSFSRIWFFWYLCWNFQNFLSFIFYNFSSSWIKTLHIYIKFLNLFTLFLVAWAFSSCSVQTQ